VGISFRPHLEIQSSFTALSVCLNDTTGSRDGKQTICCLFRCLLAYTKQRAGLVFSMAFIDLFHSLLVKDAISLVVLTARLQLQ
jgi:hypothetical protein